jgi:protein-S-isoprenylcysteine O-methyltransferase Ste14
MLLTTSANRTLTLLASAFLGFDGAALLVFGIWSRHPLLALIGAALFISSGLVLLYWRWHQRQLEEIAAARRALREETESLRELLRGN